MNELIIYEGVYRTAPATAGLLITSETSLLTITILTYLINIVLVDRPAQCIKVSPSSISMEYNLSKITSELKWQPNAKTKVYHFV